MKKSFGILVGLLVVSFTAQAVYRPGWDRPKMASSAEVVRSSGEFAGLKTVKVVLTEQDGNRAKGLRLEFQSRRGLMQSLQYYRAGQETGSCGSRITTYVQYGRSVFGNLKHIDHTMRYCTDIQYGLQEIVVSRGRRASQMSELRLVLGEWEPVVTIQKF
jgi:hypothetical protein